MAALLHHRQTEPHPQISPTPLPMHRATLVITLMVVAAINTVSAEEQTDGGRSRESHIIRLQPSAFAQLPTQIVRPLQEQGCTIPQSFVDPQPHNVVQGELRRKGQMDWAVLCSRDGHSSILVFGNISPTRITEISRQSDGIFVQGVGGGKLGYSRRIGIVGKQFIIGHYRAYGGPEPPRIYHQGIDDAFLEKASVVHYYHGGRWLELTGAD